MIAAAAVAAKLHPIIRNTISINSMIERQRADRLGRLLLQLKDGHQLSLTDRRFLYLCHHNNNNGNNHYNVHRGLFSAEECDCIINLARLQASENGWSTNRHSNYPTIDLPLFNQQRQPNGALGQYALSLIQERVINAILETPDNGRLPFVKGDLCILDAFVVRYSINDDGSGDGDGQIELPLHTDGSLISFNLALNDQFTGGGTYFEHLKRTERLAVGDALIHWSKLLHAGQPIDSGERLILVAFIDTKDTSKLR